MPVTGATTRNDYTASAGQAVFSYTFQILLATDIKVIKNGTLLTLNNDYTVSNVGVAGGGNVTLTSGANSGDAIAILLGMPIDRTTEYQNAGDFLASDVNGDFDKAYVALNQVQTDVSRTLHLQDQDPSVDMELPLASERANKYLAFNAAGHPVATSDASTGTSSTLTFKDFGAVGDGVTDDTQALQDAFDYATANRAVLAPTRGVFLVNAPIIVGDFSGIKGYTSNNQDASCVIKAGSSFASTYTMTYYDPEVGGGSTPLTYNIASILISKAWVDGVQVGNPIYIGKILLDGDSKKGSRGEPIHGLMMQAWASYVECNTANTTGYGIFFNLQKSNGDFAGNHVGNHFKANRVYKSGITPTGDSSPLSYTLNGQTHYYGAFQAGSLEFSRDSAGNQSRGKATDAWITDFVQANTCTGTAIRVINGGGWSGTGIHLNGPGRHGIYVDGCLSSGWTNNYVDGWGAHIDDNEGNFYAFWFADIFGFEDDEANASLTCSDNRVRLRDIPNKTGNKLVGYGAKGTAASTARVIMNGNSYTARPDVTAETVAISYPFNFSGIQQGGLNITLNGNDLDPDSYPQDTNLYLVNFGRYIQFSSQTGNSWQTVTAKPTRRGARGEIVYRKDAVGNEPTHYLNVSGIDHGYDWKAMGSSRSGTTAERPTLDSNDSGFQYFDTTLNDPIWWTGTAWEYADASNQASVIDLTDLGGSPSASASVNTTAIESAWTLLRNGGGRIVISEAGTWNFNNSTFARTTKPIEIEAVDGVLLYPGNPQATTWMWDFQSDTGVTQVSFTNVRVSGQKADNTREEFLGIRVGPSNNLTAYKCFGRYVNGTAWQFLRPHNSEIDMTTFFCGKDGDTDANRFAMMITGILDVPNGQDDVFNDVRLSGTSEKDYYGWVVEGGTILRTTSQLKMHGSAYSKRAFQLHRVAEFDVEITATQRYNKNGFVHFSDAGNGGGITLFQNCTGASLPIRGTAALSNATNLQVYTGDVSGYPTAAPASAIDAYVFDMASQFSGVKCTGLLSPQAAVDVTAGNFVNGIQYRISDLGSAGNAAWVTYTGVSATYKVGDFFTGTSNDSSLLTGAVVTRRYAMVGLAAPGDEFARPYLGELGQTTQVFDQFLRDERTDSDRELIQEFLPAIDAAKIEQFGSQTPRFRITRLFGQRTANPPAAFDRRGSVSGSNNDIISLERGGLKTGGIGVEASADSSQEVTFIDSSYELAETVNAGDFVTGQRYSISNLGSAGNAAWVTFLGARPGGGDYVTGDLFVAPGNGSALTGAQAQIYHLGAGLSFDKTAVLPRQDQARVDKVVSLGSADHAFNELFLGDIKILSGTGDPSAGSGTAAPQGSMFLRTDGGASTTLYVKTGGGNTDWTAK